MRTTLLCLIALSCPSLGSSQDAPDPRQLSLVDSTCAPGACRCRGLIDSTGTLAASGVDHRALRIGVDCLAADFDGNRTIDVALTGGEGIAVIVRRLPTGALESHVADAGGVLELYEPRTAAGPHGEPRSSFHGLFVRDVGKEHVVILWDGQRFGQIRLPAWPEAIGSSVSTAQSPRVARPSRSTSESPWRELVRGDLHAIRETLLEHHPGPVDSLNPGFREWLDRGYARSMALADSVTSLDGAMAVLSWYTSGFHDGHLGWGSDFVRRSLMWPGVVVSKRGTRYVVHHAEAWVTNAPAVGAEIVSCDGVTMDDRLAREVLPFEGGIKTLESSRARLAPSLLLWDFNPVRTRPAVCLIRENGSTRALPLAWRAIATTRVDSLRERAAYGVPPATFTISTPAAGVAWVTVPSFAENEGDNRAGLESLVARLPHLRDSSLIVFDVRGNRGGNSYWGRQLLGALFGSEYIVALSTRLDHGVYVQWRASEGNAAFVERSTLPRFHPGSDVYREIQRTISSMRSAIVAGVQLTPPPTANVAPTVDRGVAPLALGRRVVLLTDGWCGSACLGFCDLLLSIPGVRHAGATTFADAVYIDNRAVRLPSGLGLFGFSMKVWRNRPRRNNEPYVPTLVYQGLNWDTAALQDWLVRVAR